MTDAVLWIGLATFVATLLGPVLAVEVSRRRDEARARYQRKLDVFRALMRFRLAPVAPEFVNALNLIEVEFYDVKDVLVQYRRFLDNVPGPTVSNDEENRIEIS